MTNGYHPSFPVVQPTYASLLQGNKVGNVSVLLAKSLLKVSGLYDPHVVLRRTTDWDLWLRIAQIEPPCLVPEVLARGYGGLADAIGMNAPWVEFEDFSLMVQLSRNAELMPERILDYEVASLERYVDQLPAETVDRLYHHLVLPWLNQRREQFETLGIMVRDTEAAKAQKGYARPYIRVKELYRYFKGKPVALGATIRGAVCSLVTYYKAVCLADPDAWDAIPSGFQRIKDDPFVAGYRSNGFLLQKSPNIQHVPFLSYPITLSEGELRAISLAIVAGVSSVHGSIGVEVVSAENNVVAHVRMPAAYVCSSKPAEFFLEPPIEAGRYLLRVFGNRLSRPVHLLEFRKYTPRGGIIKRPFCGFILA